MLLLVGSVFLMGLSFGPVALAALRAFSAPTEEWERHRSAGSLLQAFDQRTAAPLGTSSFDWSIVARDCGYDVDQLFRNDPEDRLEMSSPWTPGGGYFDLLVWYEAVFELVAGQMRAEYLAASLSAFDVSFLNTCIRETVFAPLCADKVNRRLAAAGLLRPSDFSAKTSVPEAQRRFATICMYLDGAAARAVLTLSPRATR
jgi:hypothetical protein